MAQCEGTSKKTGKRCTAAPITGETLCAGHARRGISSDPERYSKVGGEAKAAAARKRAAAVQRERDLAKLSMRELVGVRLHERRDDVLRVLLDQAIEEKDRRTLLSLFSEAFGRPTERVETSAERDPLESMTPEERRQLIASITDAYPHLRAA